MSQGPSLRCDHPSAVSAAVLASVLLLSPVSHADAPEERNGPVRAGTSPDTNNAGLLRSFAERPTTAIHARIADRPLTQLKLDWRRFQNDSEGWRSFLWLIASGDPLAIDLAVKLMPLTEGGNLGDLCRAVNRNISGNAKPILISAARYAISSTGFESLLTCLPLETVDDFRRQASETQARLAAVRRVDEPQLEKLKATAMKIYQDRLAAFDEAIEMEKRR